ncbi:MAG: AI-2E family transporter [Pseudomonadota bacterium]|nr:AI-2E family transporter [Pseudomonadota bacterium]
MSRLSPDAQDARFIRRVVILIVILGGTFVLFRAANMLILAFGSILGGIAIRAVADLYARLPRVRPRAALALGIFSVLAVLAFLGWLFAVHFASQVDQLVIQTPQLAAKFDAWLSQSAAGAQLSSAIKSSLSGSRIAKDAGEMLRGGGEFVLNAIVMLFGAMFFATDPQLYRRGLLLLVPPRQRPAFADATNDVAATLRRWLRAELIGMTTMGVLIGTGLWLSGVPSAGALGLLAGLSEFIPYVGPTAAMLPALGLGAAAGQGPLIGALATYSVVRLIQTNLITPFVQAQIVSIPPAVTLFAIIGTGLVFGLFAMFFSAGLLVVIFTLIRSLYLRDVLGERIDADA